MTTALLSPQTFTYDGQEPGFCRVYFRGDRDRKRYCAHYSGRGSRRVLEEFLTCSADGEPDTPFHAVPALTRLQGVPASFGVLTDA